MKNNNFEIEIIARGSYVDKPHGDGTEYTVEATTIRLNPIALNEWLRSEPFNVRECYETASEWEDYKAKRAREREGFYARIMEALSLGGRGDFDGSIRITQAQSEVFTVVRIWKNER